MKTHALCISMIVAFFSAGLMLGWAYGRVEENKRDNRMFECMSEKQVSMECAVKVVDCYNGANR